MTSIADQIDNATSNRLQPALFILMIFHLNNTQLWHITRGLNKKSKILKRSLH